MGKPVLIATSNQGKFKEILEILNGMQWQFLSLQDIKLGDHKVKENGKSFAENALKKARYYYKQSRIMTIAEDSGIIVDALKNQLGVKTRRWGAGEKASDREWIDYFLQSMKNIPLEKRTARFICHAAIIDNEGKEHLFSGETEGTITFTLEAPIYKGLPLSSCFKPDGFTQVYSSLPIKEKNKVSHRGKAFQQLQNFLLSKSDEC